MSPTSFEGSGTGKHRKHNISKQCKTCPTNQLGIVKEAPRRNNGGGLVKEAPKEKNDRLSWDAFFGKSIFPEGCSKELPKL